MFSVRSLSRFAFGIFLSAGGLFILAALDSTIFFFFPFGIAAMGYVFYRQ